MAIMNKPDEQIFASGARQGEVITFPDILRGWGISFDETAGIPPMEYFNALFKRLDEKDLYHFQRGLPEWSATLDYPQHAFVQYNGSTYRSKTAHRNQRPDIANSTYWAKWAGDYADFERLINELRNQKVDKTAISDSVSSTSQTTVASSRAVKTAYDKGVEGLNKANEAKSLADSAYSLANGKQSPATTLAGYGITDFKVQNLSTENLNEVMTAGIYGQPANVQALASRNYPEQQAGTLLVTNSAYGVQQEYTVYYNNHKYVRGRNEHGWRDWVRIDGIDKVNRSGDTMTGILEIDTPNAIVRGRRNGELGWYIGFPNSQIPDLHIRSYIHNTQCVFQSNRIEANKELFVNSNKVHHAGDNRVWTKAETWGGLIVERQSKNDLMIFETNEANQFSFIRRNRTTQQNDYVIYLPKKNGTAVLDTDFPTHTTSIATSTNHSASGQPYYSGWTRLPNGLLLQWGTGSSGGGYSRKLNFPIAFNEVYTVVSSEISGGEKNFDRDVIWSKTQVWTAHAYQLSYLAIGR